MSRSPSSHPWDWRSRSISRALRCSCSISGAAGAWPQPSSSRRSGCSPSPASAPFLPRVERSVKLRSLKRLVVGRPLETLHLESERLSKTTGLAVLSSDALSSSAYATEQMLLVLMLSGLVGAGYALRVGAFILLLLVIVVISYRQTVHAYPGGGGAYFVAKENLGTNFGLVAAAALLVDYVLTVTVSVAAGVDAITSAFPGALPYRIAMGLVAILVITLGNLRGVRESGALFSVPTYFFIVMFALMLVVN